MATLIKTISFYRTSQYGTPREFIAPSHTDDAKLVQSLIGQKTITAQVRETLTKLTNGVIQWQEVIAPR